MKRFKKLISAGLCVALLGTTMVMPSYAFHGYSHWDIARRVAVSKNIPTANNQRLIYQSGTLAADLGKAIGWDDTHGVNSDSSTFSNKIVSLADTTNEKWFAAGWRDHVTQDTRGDVMNNISSSHTNYTLKCGWLDEYLRDTRNISCPINGTANLFLSYGLIRETYDELCNFSPTDAQINSAISKMYSAYNSAILANFYGMNSTEISEMDAEFDRVAALCGGTNINSIGGDVEVLKTEVDAVVDLMNSESNKEEVDAILCEIEEVTELQTVSSDGEFTELKFVIVDEDAYNELLNELCMAISE